MTLSRQRVRLALLRSLALLSSPFYSQSPGALPHCPRILLIRPDHIGDVLFATPALRVLRKAYPDAHIACLIGPWGRAVLEGSPHVDEIITCEFPGFRRKRKSTLFAPYQLLLNWARDIRKQRFDMAIVLRFDHWWGALLAYLARIPRRIGYAIPECRPFLSQALPYVSERHEVQQNLTLVQQAIVQGGQKMPEDALDIEFTVTDQDRQWAARYMAEHSIATAQDLVAIHPGAGAAVKLWPPQAWGQVGNALSERYPVRIIITGGPEELDLAWSVYAHMHAAAMVAAGRTTLGQLAALFQRCRLVLGPDCGPLHLAVAVGTPTIHLYGPVDAVKFGPWGDPGRHIVLTSERGCIPCNRLDYTAEELPDHPCVREIAAEAVLQAADRLLTQIR